MADGATTPSPVTDWINPATLEAAIVERGASAEVARQVAALGCDAGALEAADPDRTDRRPFTKLGGVPDLPPGMTWPMRAPIPEPFSKIKEPPKPRLLDTALKGLGPRKPSYFSSVQPFNFIGQVSFAELAAAGVEDPALPTEGAFYLFYDDVSQRWGDAPVDRMGFKVLYAADISKTTPADRPVFDEQASVYSELRMDVTRTFEAPEPDALDVRNLPVSRETLEPFIDLYFDQRGARDDSHALPPNHKVRGWSDWIQDTMEEEAALRAGGIYWMEDARGRSVLNDPEKQKAILSAPNDWVLLMQVDCDPKVGFEWGDAGKLYLWIKRSDMDARNFDNTWLILQCH